MNRVVKRPRALAATACLVLMLLGCDRAAAPREACSAPEATSAVMDVIVDQAKALRGPGLPHFDLSRADLRAMMKLDLVVLDSHDPDTLRTRCRGQLNLTAPPVARKLLSGVVGEAARLDGYFAGAALDPAQVPEPLARGDGRSSEILFTSQPSADRASTVITVENVGPLAAAYLYAAVAAEAARADGAQPRTDAADEGVPALAAGPPPRFSSNSYVQVRRELLAQGYQPAPSRAFEGLFCREELESGTVADDCSQQVALPEIADCSGGGRASCLAIWRAPDGRRLVVISSGEPQPGSVQVVRWAQPGDLDD